MSLGSNRRNRLQMIIDVLRVCETPSSQYKIVRSVETNWNWVSEALETLIECKALEKQFSLHEGSAAYVTTPKGLEFVQWYLQGSSLVVPLINQVDDEYKQATARAIENVIRSRPL